MASMELVVSILVWSIVLVLLPLLIFFWKAMQVIADRFDEEECSKDS